MLSLLFKRVKLPFRNKTMRIKHIIKSFTLSKHTNINYNIYNNISIDELEEQLLMHY